MNIVTLKSLSVPKDLAQKYDLVPETQDGNNNWYTVILMSHVEIDDQLKFVNELKS